MRTQFKFLSGDSCWEEYGGMFISKKFNLEFEYCYIMEVYNLEGYMNDVNGKYKVSLSVVSPSQVSKENWKGAIASCGGIGYKRGNWRQDVEMLYSYGCKAVVFLGQGNNLRKLMKEARNEVQKCNMLFGFYMDRNQNQIGSTGWDLLKGNILAGLHHKERECLEFK